MLYSRFQSPGFKFHKQKFPGFWNSSHEARLEMKQWRGVGYDVAMYTFVNKKGRPLQKCNLNIEMFYFIINRNRNDCFKK